MVERFEVNSNYGGAPFETQKDAINALFLLSHYHNVDINREEIKKALEEKGFYEVPTAASLSIKKAYFE